MAAEDDVFDLQGIDGVFDYCGCGEVGRGDDVGDVAVDEAGSRFGAEDGRFGLAGVGAAESLGWGSVHASFVIVVGMRK